ncbi:AAA family ATPase [Streptomyces sp. PTM05]|uniref:AAA family ATPase n=1 Tax=Streptantibioticus parmotrematis TaxID=2873249 RepID=A0ABS7QS87_9ACTN|nr:LuxR family transcriptional regulator [Streptantibioticus parmotrematis]MBY8886048.1 AAA family ATPase [Streptantibioticus parmotrematis]
MAGDRAQDVGPEHGATAGRTHLGHLRLVGRDRELAELDAWIDDPDAPRVMVVEGERGAGRTAFADAAAERLRGRGRLVLPLACRDGDERDPLLLALRVVVAAWEHRSAAGRVRPDLRAEAVSAVDRGDRTAVADALVTALTQAAPVAVVVDDVQHADPASLDVLGTVTARVPPPGVRLVVTSLRHTPGGGPVATGPRGRAVGPPAGHGVSRTIALPCLTPGQIADLTAPRLQAVPDAALVERVFALTRGVPAAADALLSAWAGRDAVRVADGHAFLAPDAPTPLLPDDDRFMRALGGLGEPCAAVAAALSVLWPLGRTAATMAARSTGLSEREVAACTGRLVAVGVLDELPWREAHFARGWTFRSPLVEHTVRERSGPLSRARLSAAAVEALWAAGDGTGGEVGPDRPALIVDEAEAQTYLLERIVDAGGLVDRDRAVSELTAAADALHPDHEDRRMLRWLRAALRLIEDPAARELALLRCAKGAWVVGDHRTAGGAAETILRAPSDALSGPELQEIANLLVGATAAGKDWPRLSRMGSARWWEALSLPAVAAVPAQALALCLAERWQEAVDLLSRTRAQWATGARGRLLPDLARAVGNVVRGTPGSLPVTLLPPQGPGVPPDLVYAMTAAYCELLLGVRDLAGTTSLLRARGLTPEALPAHSRFLLLHLQGRCDEAMALSRWLFAKEQTFAPAPHHHLLPARTAAILVAKGRPAAAARLIDRARGDGDGPLEVFLDLADGAVLSALGRPEAAGQVLRRGLRAADARGYVHGTDELAAALTVVQVAAGRPGEAAASLRRLEDVAARTGNERTRLLRLLASARLAGRYGSDDVRDMLHEAVELARSRGQPFETAVTLSAAARGADRPELLHEAYELFGETGAALRRFHTRSAMRAAGLAVPGRKQSAEENERLLAALLTDGLTNRQIATVLRLSEDAVANRLTRLFARTGLRSRTEFVSAMLTGDPLGEGGR